MPGPAPTPPAERLRRYVVAGGPGECWEFQGFRDSRGYGRLNVGGRPVPAHRVAWEAEHGPIPDGQLVCHHCDNPPCCNVAHLFLGTVADNNADMRAKGRARGNRQRGEQSPSARLSDEAVATIRARYAEGGVTQRALGAEFGVTQAQVSNIVRGRQRA